MTADQASVAAMIALARQEPSRLWAVAGTVSGFLVDRGATALRNPAYTGARDVEDLVQDAFLKAFQGFPQFAGTTEPEFSAWLGTNYANTLKDLVRKRGRDARYVEPCFSGDDSASFIWHEPADTQSTPSQRMIKAEKALPLGHLLQSLPEAQRDAVRLRHLEGWPLERIAAELGRSVAAAASLIKRGLRAPAGRHVRGFLDVCQVKVSAKGKGRDDSGRLREYFAALGTIGN